MKRYLSLDILRGLSIFGMVFSAIIPFGNLPAWMYHIQNPPPDHKFDMSVSGISWVDLVFPIFIFCMGVAIPLAGRAKLQTSEKINITGSYTKGVLERFLMLWIFSYLYVFLNFSTAKGWDAQLATVAGFLALFPLYYNFGKNSLKRNVLISRIAGIVLITALILFGHYRYNEVISIGRSGIIIFLLAFLYLFGALIWYFTRDNLRSRILIFILILAFTAVTIPLGIQPKLYAIESIRWFFNAEYIYFLLILIPATYVGDLIYKRLSDEKQIKGEEQPGLYIAVVLAILSAMFTLYKGYHIANLVISALLGATVYYLAKVRGARYGKESMLALVLFVAGSIFLLAEGAITKSPCTISYCFITGAISIYLLILTDRISELLPGSLFTRIFSGAGSNPLMSYIAYGSFVMPLFKLTGIIYIYQAAYPDGYPWIGVLRAAFAVLLTMALVAKMSEKKIFWRA